MAAESPTTTTASTGRSGDPARRQRADAQRNVLALLQAAKTVFADSGVDAPAKEITDLAGVGVGTLYRHFPRRSDLIVAVLEHDIDGCIHAARELTITLEPWDAPHASHSSRGTRVCTRRHDGPGRPDHHRPHLPAGAWRTAKLQRAHDPRVHRGTATCRQPPRLKYWRVVPVAGESASAPLT
jgi:AcrR family transcriptional regulator